MDESKGSFFYLVRQDIFGTKITIYNFDVPTAQNKFTLRNFNIKIKENISVLQCWMDSNVPLLKYRNF